MEEDLEVLGTSQHTHKKKNTHTLTHIHSPVAWEVMCTDDG